MLAEIATYDWDASFLGFDELKPQDTEVPVDAQARTDEAEEIRKRWGTQRNQVWVLGDHRLMCGDSTSASDFAALMHPFNADICFTSPPYALGKSMSLSGNRSMAGEGNAYIGHEDNPEGWRDLMDKWFPVVSKHCSAQIVNVQSLAGNKRDLFQWLGQQTDRLADVAIWDKGHAAPAMAQGVLASRFELMLIFGDTEASRSIPFSSWRGTVQNVYQGPPQRGNEFSGVHAATMPIHLPIWAIGTLCDMAQTVIEPFCGTGTTILACENLKKRCFAMEISPEYVAVTLQRFADATGKIPTLLQ
jgi:DNA modification methylase